MSTIYDVVHHKTAKSKLSGETSGKSKSQKELLPTRSPTPGGELVIIMPKSMAQKESVRTVALASRSDRYANLVRDESSEADIISVALASRALNRLDEVDAAGLTMGAIMKDKPANHLLLMKARFRLRAL